MNRAQKAIATNCKAFFNYEILDRFEAGVMLAGTEVKSIREGGLNFRDFRMPTSAVWSCLCGCRIGPYSHGNILKPRRGPRPEAPAPQGEILKLGGKATEKGFTIVLLRAY
jgi:SsrA-binding protein